MPTFINVLFDAAFQRKKKTGRTPVDYLNGFAVFDASIYACGKYIADKLGFIYDTLTEDTRDVGYFLRRNIGSTRYVILHVFPYRQLGFLSDDWAWIACLRGLEGEAMSAAEKTINWEEWRMQFKEEV